MRSSAAATEQIARACGLRSVLRQPCVDEDQLGRDLIEPVTLRLVLVLGRGDEQAKDQGGHRRHQAHSELYHVLGIVAEMILG